MGDQTKIEWAHKTFNGWIGCTKVGPGCDNCYAERDFDLRKGIARWGAGKPRHRTGEANWAKPYRWDREAHERRCRYRVFCMSLADWADNEIDAEWRADLWTVIRATPHLDWLLLTKRVGNIERMLPADWAHDTTRRHARYGHVWLGLTVVNQLEVDRDVSKLMRIPASVRWLSIEPMLGPVMLREDAIDWVVCGGESGDRARPLDVSWCVNLKSQCRVRKISFFMKQGSQLNWPQFKVFESFPPALQVREFPR